MAHKNKKLRVALAQMRSTPDKEKNLKQAENLLKKAVQKKVSLIAFPENFALLTEGKKNVLAQAEEPNGLIMTTVKSWARKNRIWILAGSAPIRTRGNQITNSSFLISPQGKIAARYDKIHLFDVELPDRAYRESSTVKPGSKIIVKKTPIATFGFSVCYDLRFPELYRSLSKRGANVIFIPSAFTVPTGRAHWDSLTRTRAIENQAYVMAPGQVGVNYPGRETYGHSRLIDPWGRVIAEKKTGVGIACGEIDFMELSQIRKKLPSLQHRVL